MHQLSRIESEFENTEDAEAHERWFRGKVEASLADLRPTIPHAAVLAELSGLTD